MDLLNTPASMSETFAATGAISVVTGVMVDSERRPVGPGMQVQFSGKCELALATREGLAELQAQLLEAVGVISQAMVTAPSMSEVGSRVVKAQSIPPPAAGLRIG